MSLSEDLANLGRQLKVALDDGSLDNGQVAAAVVALHEATIRARALEGREHPEAEVFVLDHHRRPQAGPPGGDAA